VAVAAVVVAAAVVAAALAAVAIATDLLTKTKGSARGLFLLCAPNKGLFAALAR
jgi:hypothetical protein